MNCLTCSGSGDMQNESLRCQQEERRWMRCYRRQGRAAGPAFIAGQPLRSSEANGKWTWHLAAAVNSLSGYLYCIAFRKKKNSCDRSCLNHLVNPFSSTVQHLSECHRCAGRRSSCLRQWRWVQVVHRARSPVHYRATQMDKVNHKVTHYGRCRRFGCISW